jgi:hypothetical protein
MDIYGEYVADSSLEHLLTVFTPGSKEKAEEEGLGRGRRGRGRRRRVRM